MGLESPRINATVSGTTTATVVNADDLEVDSGTLSVDATNNRIGIGTTTPASTLEIEGSSGDLTIEIDNNVSNSANLKITSGAGNARADFVVDGNNHLTMKSQRVGIVTTNPAYTLDVTGNGNFTSDLTVGGDVTISGTTPLLTIGDAGTEDTMLVFDGNAVDFRIGIDDGTDTLEIGKGAAHGTTPVIKIDSNTNLQTVYNAALSDTEYSGDLAMFTAGEDLEVGECVYYKTDGKVWKAVATAAATSRCVAMCVVAVSADAIAPFLLKGFARFDTNFPTFTVGGPIYTPEAEASSKNVPEDAAPDTDGDFVQIIGWAVSANIVYFCPDSTVIEVA